MDTIDMGRMTKRKKPNSIVKSVVEGKPQSAPMKLSQNSTSPNMARTAQNYVEQGSSTKKARQFTGGHYDNLANTAMANVNYRNKLKMGMEQNKILSNLAANKANNDSRERINTQNNLNRVGINFANNSLAREKMRQDNAIKYQQLNAQLRGQDINKDIAMQNMAYRNKPKPINKLDEMAKRKKIYGDIEAFKSALPEDVRDGISNDQLMTAHNHYIDTGEIQNFKKNDGWWSGYSPTNGTQGQQQQPQAQQQPQEAFKIDTNQSNELMHDVAKNFGVSLADMTRDSRGNIVTPDGTVIPLQQAWEHYSKTKGQ